MFVRPVFLLICVVLFLILRTPRVQGQSTKMDGNDVHGPRIYKRNNFMLQSERSRENLGSFDNASGFGTHLSKQRNADGMSAFIEDYANIINDVIMLSKYVETRPKKQGIKLEKKYTNLVLKDPPCACNSSVAREFLGDDSFPRSVETRVCSENQPLDGCKPPYICRESKYNLQILRWKRTMGQDSQGLPKNLGRNWNIEIKPISVGCMCLRDYETYLAE